MLTSPKTRFLQRTPDAAKQHAELCGSPEFVQITELVLLEMLYQARPEADPAEAAAAYQRMIGAREYVKRLLAIGTPETVPARTTHSGQLKYDA